MRAYADEADLPTLGASVENVLEAPIDANGNSVFAKGADNLLVGAVAGVGEDEDGNIMLDPEKFILGLGGYTVAKALVKNPRVQKEIKDLVMYALDDLDEAISKSAGGGNPLNEAKKNVQKVIGNKKPSTQVGKSKDTTPLVFDRGETWTVDGKVRGYGFEKLWEKHVLGQKDLTINEIISHPELMKYADEYENKGNVVFDFPSRKTPIFRIVFGKPKENKQGIMVRSNVSMFERSVDGQLTPVIPDNKQSLSSVSPSAEISDLHTSGSSISQKTNDVKKDAK